MNKFTKTKKLAISVLLALALILTMAITVFAESADSGAGAPGSVWENPQFYGFLAVVAGFIAVVGGGVALYFARNYQNKVQANKDADGTSKLYEDLDDTMWEKGPDTVFITTLEPPAAVLTDLKPVEKIYGLDGFVITEQPIDPGKALNMGADPFAYMPHDTAITQAVFEEVQNTPIEDTDVVSHTLTKSIEKPEAPQSAPATYLSHNVDEDAVKNSYDPTEVAVLGESVPAVALEDEIVPVKEETPVINEAILPKAQPASHVAKEVPITIFTSDDEDGVVQIKASIFENTLAPTVLVDEPKPVVKP